MKVLVVGSGGREHALVWKIAQNPLADAVYAAPGNDGMINMARCVPIQATDVNGLLAFARQEGIGLTIVGGEEPLAAGIIDAFQAAGLVSFGPTKAAAQIETDKGWALDLMHKHGIPTGWSYTFSSEEAVSRCVQNKGFPVVVKNPYLARGKGSFICHDTSDLFHAVVEIRSQQYRQHNLTSHKFVVMEYLEGEEVSITAISDGEHLVYLPSSQDHKRLLDGDKGPMTGGMGAIAPAPYITPELQTVIHEQIMLPTIRAMAKGGRPYKGVLYAGLILTADGPKVLEFNCRFGDPEAQVILPLLKTDLVELLLAAIDGSLDKVKVEIENKSTVCVILASEGYGERDDPLIGVPIWGSQAAERIEFVQLFHAGTQRAADGVGFVTSGGRVLGVTAVEGILPFAMEMAYGAASFIDFQGKQYRRDIGQKALRYLAGQK